MFTALILPAFLVLLVGFAFVGNIKSVPIMVINEDKGHGDVNDGLQLANLLMRSDQLDVKYFGNWLSVQDGINLIRDGKYSALVFIPYDFTDRVLMGKPYIEVYVDGADPVTGYTCSSAILTIAGQFGSRGGVRIEPDFLFNTNVGHASSSVQLNQLRFIIPGQIGVILSSALTGLSASTVVAERERGSFEQLLVSPISGSEMLLGKILYHVIFIGFYNIASMLFVIVFLLDVPIVGNLSLVLLLLVIYTLASVGFGILISVTSNTQIAATQTTIYFIAVEVWLSGIVYPIRAMPLILRPVAYSLPLTYLGDGLRALMIRGADFATVQNDFIATIVFVVIAYILAVKCFTKRID
jgi:ABC-2 type transport system permease protein